MNADMARAMWERAFESEIGIAIGINEEDRKNVLATLYKVREGLRDPRLENLVVIHPKRDPAEIWIVHKTVELDP